MTAVERAGQVVAEAEIAWRRAPSRQAMSRLIRATRFHAAEELRAAGHHSAADFLHADKEQQ